jgi:hypothetical protein
VMLDRIAAAREAGAGDGRRRRLPPTLRQSTSARGRG